MQKVFDEVLTLDKRCYEEFGLSEDLLMEHAAMCLANSLKTRLSPKSKILFLCGPGNNGGDGIACARILHKEYNVCVYMPYGAKSNMAKLQLKRYTLVGGKIIDKLETFDGYVDALFGSGLKRELDKGLCKIIKEINEKQGLKISCDIPSGIGTGFISDEVFNADITISMGALKLPLFEDMAKDFVGDIEVANLGVAREIYENHSDTFLLENQDMLLPLRKRKNTNKGVFGHTSIVQGEKRGAAILAANAALNFGSGLVTIVSKNRSDIPPYLMNSDTIPTNSTSIVIGMGLGNRNFDLTTLSKKDIPLVIDADLFHDRQISKLLASRDNIVLTPHPKEFASLLEILNIAKVDTKEIQKERFKYTKKFTQKYPSITLVLKGANTIIAHNKKLYINILGTNILSKGGSGDVLAGMIGALLAQNYTTSDAAISAVLAHSIAAKNIGINNYALNPLDICKEIKCL